MPHVLECSNGHRWGSQIGEVESGEHNGTCPVCGAAAVVPVAADVGTSPSPSPPDADESLLSAGEAHTLSGAAEDTIQSGTAARAELDEVTQVSARSPLTRPESVDERTIVEMPGADASATEGTIELQSGAVRAEEASDSTAVIESKTPSANRPASVLEATTFIPPKTRPEIGGTSGDTTFLPPESQGQHPGSHLLSTQFSPPPTMPDKKLLDQGRTTVFEPDSTQRPPQQEETAFMTGQSPPQNRAADPSATAVLDSSSAPSASEATANFDSGSDSTTAGDSAATGILGETPSSAGTLDDKASPSRPKSRARLGLKEISGYEIISELGRGGMGVVYKARQKGIGRLVALKRILSNDISQNDIVRFRIEAEAVGKIKHPNIVLIYEMGEDKGKPWCALEYLDGGSLHGKLKGEPQPVRKIAEILEPLCRALDACHKEGIIHRDIKPANILLGSDGTPKLTDFGLAKDLTDSVGQTRSGTILGTPSYMAPEQAQGNIKEIGPAADIYSVGAMMYEMITGRPPLKGETVIDTLLLVQGTDPMSPSVLIPKVPRDLETICMKCLEKTPAKRYSSAGALADDLRRFLDGEPISARPITAPEKAKRWVKKHPKTALSLSSVCAFFLVVIVASIAVAQSKMRETALAIEKQEEETKRADAEAREKEAQTKRADTEEKRREDAVIFGNKIAEQKGLKDTYFEVARDTVDKMLTQIGQERLAHRPKMEQLRRHILSQALTFYEFLQTVGDTHKDDPSLLWETGRAFLRVGDIREMLGERTEAEQSYRKGIGYLEKLVKEYPHNQFYQADLATGWNNLGNLLRRFNSLDEAARAYQQSLVLNQQLDAAYRPLGLPPSLMSLSVSPVSVLTAPFWAIKNGYYPGYVFGLAQNYNNLGVLALSRNQLKEAEDYFKQALAVYEPLVSAYPKSESYRFNQAQAYDNLGELLAKLGKTKDANKAYSEARELLIQLVETGKADPPGYRQELAKCYDHLGNLLRDTDPPRAQKLHQNSLALRIKLVEDYPDMLDYRQEQATSLNNMGIAWLAAGDVDKANQMFSEGLQAQERLVALAPLDRGFRSDLAGSYVNAAILLHQKNVFKDAEKYYAESLNHLDQLVKRYPSVPDYLRDTAAVMANVCILQLSRGEPKQALDSAQKSLAMRERLAQQWPQVPAHLQEVARSYAFLGTLLRQLGKPAEAEKPYRRAIEILTQLDQKYKNVPDYAVELATTYNSLADLLKTPESADSKAVPAARSAEAEKSLRLAIDLLARLSKTYPTIPLYQKEGARSEAALAQFLDAANKNTEADDHWQRALAILGDLRTKYPDQPVYLLDLAQTLGKRGFAYSMANRYQRAQECLFQAIEILEPLATENPRVPEYWTELFLDYENLARSVRLLDLLQDTENIRRHMISLREKQLAAFPGNADLQCNLAGSFNDLAAILALRGKLADAEKTYQKAINDLRGLLAKKPQPAGCAARLTQAYVGLADAELERANHAEAALAMADLTNLVPANATEQVRVAGVLARCADLTSADEMIPSNQRQELSRRYADRAMEALRKAVSQGYKDVDYLKQAVALAPIRSRPDFQQLVSELQGR